MVNCKSNCGCSACSVGNGSTNQNSTSGYTPVGALGTLCRNSSSCGNGCGCNNSCGNHHCGNGCGNHCNNGCNCGHCGCLNGETLGNDYPFYTGPCPPAPCNGCGCKPPSHCGSCGSSQCCGACRACVVYDGDTYASVRGCRGCTGCNCGSGRAPGCGCSGDGHRCGCGEEDCGNVGDYHHCREREVGCNYHGDCHHCECNGCSHCGSTTSAHNHYGCSEAPSGCVTPVAENACSGMFAANGPFHYAPGCTVNLKAHGAETHYFAVHDGCITIRKAGTYHLAVIVNIPDGETAETILSLELDGRCIPPELNIETCAGSDYAGHTVFHAEAGSKLKLNTKNPLCCAATHNPVITLIVTRISAGLSPAPNCCRD